MHRIIRAMRPINVLWAIAWSCFTVSKWESECRRGLRDLFNCSSSFLVFDRGFYFGKACKDSSGTALFSVSFHRPKAHLDLDSAFVYSWFDNKIEAQRGQDIELEITVSVGTDALHAQFWLDLICLLQAQIGAWDLAHWWLEMLFRVCLYFFPLEKWWSLVLTGEWNPTIFLGEHRNIKCSWEPCAWISFEVVVSFEGLGLLFITGSRLSTFTGRAT